MTGLKGYPRGVAWLLEHPGYVVLLLLPLCFSVLAFMAGMWCFWQFGSEFVTSVLMSWFSAWVDHWAWDLAYFLVRALLWFSVMLVCLVAAIALSAALASPIYEIISSRIEKELLGDARHRVPWSKLPGLFVGELAKALVVTFVPLIMSVVPGVNLFAVFAAAFLLGWDFYDYPLARRGWSLRERWRFVRGEFWTVFGFGLWLVIPVLQILLVPMAVAGGTILNLEALQRRGLAGVSRGDQSPKVL